MYCWLVILVLGFYFIGVRYMDKDIVYRNIDFIIKVKV